MVIEVGIIKPEVVEIEVAEIEMIETRCQKTGCLGTKYGLVKTNYSKICDKPTILKL